MKSLFFVIFCTLTTTASLAFDDEDRLNTSPKLHQHDELPIPQGNDPAMLQISVAAPLAAYMVDRFTLHWVENVLSHQQKFGKGTIHTIHDLWRTKSLYKGLFGPSLMSAPARVLTLSTYYTGLSYLLGLGLDMTTASLTAGFAAGMVDAPASCPAENARTRAAFNMPPASNLKEFYRGHGAILGRSIGAPIILSGSTLLLYHNVFPEPLNNPWFTGLFMGIVSQAITSPWDVLKNDLMSNPSQTYYESLQTMLKTKSYYRGIGTKVFRMGAGSALVIGIIESLNNAF